MADASAHEVAVRAVAAALCGAPSGERCSAHRIDAKKALAALATAEVRAALVVALNATDGWWERDAARTADDEGQAMPGIRVWVLADAVLGALAGTDESEEQV